jgi:hypothetical protein
LYIQDSVENGNDVEKHFEDTTSVANDMSTFTDETVGTDTDDDEEENVEAND